jgi:hypothetical protein
LSKSLVCGKSVSGASLSRRLQIPLSRPRAAEMALCDQYTRHEHICRPRLAFLRPTVSCGFVFVATAGHELCEDMPTRTDLALRCDATTSCSVCHARLRVSRRSSSVRRASTVLSSSSCRQALEASRHLGSTNTDNSCVNIVEVLRSTVPLMGQTQDRDAVLSSSVPLGFVGRLSRFLQFALAGLTYGATTRTLGYSLPGCTRT